LGPDNAIWDDGEWVGWGEIEPQIQYKEWELNAHARSWEPFARRQFLLHEFAQPYRSKRLPIKYPIKALNMMELAATIKLPFQLVAATISPTTVPINKPLLVALIPLPLAYHIDQGSPV
jgi:hypothetical protein